MRSKNKHSTVRYLVGVPLYTQGSADMLCGYYCLWMLRVAYGGEKAYRNWFEQWGDGRSEDTKLRRRVVASGMVHQALKRLLYDSRLIRDDWIDGWPAAWDAIMRRTPSVVWFPKSSPCPDGHYVVVRGAATSGTEPGLIVNDPLQGERWVSRKEFDFLKVKFSFARAPSPSDLAALTVAVLHGRGAAQGVSKACVGLG
jgi:hypothetical protein